ncbi:MAG TPA: sulfatase [Candidatus Hydrogenedentes bacterium]|nr:sulfatase [Candidatus Hydrogenedentota bacterium]
MNFRSSKDMPRREFMGRVAGVAALTALGASAHAQSPRKPNVIYAFSDEHRWQSMACSEMPQLHTPVMDRMAKEGATFTHCISNYPVCTPYRAILMTGRWPYQTGMIDNNIQLSDALPTLGKTFKSAGYKTGYVGKWHLGGVRAESFGFDTSLIWTDENIHWDHGRYHPRDGKPVQPKGYNATLMTDQALQFIRNNKDNPFFLMLSLHPPHSNFLDPPPEKKALYPEGSLPWRGNVPEEIQKGKADDAKIWGKNTWPYYQGYHAHISAIDDELGRLLATLSELGLNENTIVVYTSDHGSMMGSHGLGSKRQPYEESIRVPFFIRGPGIIPPGTRCDALFGAIDILPTLCSLAGLSAPPGCGGQDFSPWMLGKTGPAPDAQLIMHISKKNASGGENHPAPLFRGLRTPRYTYAVYPDKPWCLFDNQEDPLQLKNLIDDPEFAKIRKDLNAQLIEALKNAEDPFTVPTV